MLLGCGESIQGRLVKVGVGVDQRPKDVATLLKDHRRAVERMQSGMRLRQSGSHIRRAVGP